MQVVRTLADANVLDASGQETYRLIAGHRYVLYDRETSFGLRDGALELIEGVDRTVPFYAGGPLDRERLILPFIGRKGDALATAACLTGLKERHPGITVDIAATPDALEVFELCPHLGKLIPYPLTVDRLSPYNYYLSFEEIESIRLEPERSCADVFAACLGTPRPTKPAALRVPSDALSRWSIKPRDQALVAIHVGDQHNLRSIPIDNVRALTEILAAEGDRVYWFGTEAPPDAQIDGVTNLIGKTPQVADLAAILSRMNALVTGDSFPMHLAGALDVPTLAVFTSTDAVLASDYECVTAIQSYEGCSPCHVVDTDCPLQFESCVAHQDESVAPQRLAASVRTLVAAASCA